MVLADDLNADGKLDLLVSTMNGNVYVFSSPAAYHPLKAWTSQVRVSRSFLLQTELGTRNLITMPWLSWNDKRLNFSSQSQALSDGSAS